MPNGKPWRIFQPDYDHAAVARWMRSQAMSGFMRGPDSATARYVERCITGVNLFPKPNSVTLILTRDAVPGNRIGWHFSICCVTDKGYRGYQADECEHWLELIFGPHRGRVTANPLKERGPAGILKDVRHFMLECDWKNSSDPVVTLSSWDDDLEVLHASN